MFFLRNSRVHNVFGGAIRYFKMTSLTILISGIGSTAFAWKYPRRFDFLAKSWWYKFFFFFLLFFWWYKSVQNGYKISILSNFLYLVRLFWEQTIVFHESSVLYREFTIESFISKKHFSKKFFNDFTIIFIKLF